MPPTVRRAAQHSDETVDRPIAEEVRQYTRDVIDAELHRLAHRVPSLRQPDLDIIDTVLDDLAESLILARLRSAPPQSAPLLADLFNIQTKEPSR